MSDHDVYRTELRPLVKAGAQLLDERRPGWAWSIDLRALVLEECEYCVCGQLWGDFGLGLEALWPDLDQGVESMLRAKDHGFSAWTLSTDDDLPNWAELKPRYDALNELWREQIRERTGD